MSMSKDSNIGIPNKVSEILIKQFYLSPQNKVILSMCQEWKINSHFQMETRTPNDRR